MAKKLKVPKRIAGLKIPKAIRKGPIGDFLSSSGGQVVLAEVLLTLATVYTARRFEGRTTGEEVLHHPLVSLRRGRDASRQITERLTRAFGAGVQAFRAAMQEPLPDLARTDSERADADTASEGTEPARKKRSSGGEAPLRERGSGAH